jgi:hypothetical protein
LEFPDAFHKGNPTRLILGSETLSAVSTRGEYTTDSQHNVIDSYHGVDELPELWWKFYGEREWIAGGFAWTGFDYCGEPTPFDWPSVSSNFKIVGMWISEILLLLLHGMEEGHRFVLRSQCYAAVFRRGGDAPHFQQ